MAQTASINNVNPLRRFTHCSVLTGLARTLRISGALKKAYYRFVAPPGGVLRAKVCRIEVAFYARTADELRGVERDLLAEQDFLSVLMSALCPGDVFYDVGSHIGQFAIPLAKVVGDQGQVIAFEPEAQAYQRLLDHLELNALSNVRVFRQALGERNAAGRLFVGGAACPSLVAREGDSEQQRAAEEVDIVQGDMLARTEGLPIPCAVKIDVEGYEYSVLRGLQQTLAHPACKLLCCEIHPSFLPPEVNVSVIAQFVRSLGFTHIDVPPRWTQIHMIAHKERAGHATT